jgi:hypothetical protein
MPGQEWVELPDEVALEAAQDLRRAPSLGGAARGVGHRRGVPAQPPDGEEVQGAVGLAVTAPVQAVADGLARGGRDRGDAAQVREGPLAAQPLGVVAGGHQQRGGGVGSDALDGDEVRSGLGHQVAEVGVERVDLGGQLPVPDRDRLQGDLGRRRRGARSAWPEPGGGRDQPGHAEPAQRRPQVVRCGHDQGVELVGGLGARLHRRAAGGVQRPDALDRAGARLRLGGRGPGQHRPGGRLGVDRVGLAPASVLRPLGALDLHHRDPAGDKPAAQASPVAAGPLDPDPLHRPEPSRPGQQRRMTGRGRGDCPGAEEAAELVQRGADVLIGVGVHPDRDPPVVRHLRGHSTLLLRCGREPTRTDGAADNPATRPFGSIPYWVTPIHAGGAWNAAPVWSTDPHQGTRPGPQRVRPAGTAPHPIFAGHNSDRSGPRGG